MSALGMAAVTAHWETRRCAALAAADSAASNGRPALQHLREASRCEARLNKLEHLTAKASQPRSAALSIDRGVYRLSVKAAPRSAA